MSDQGWPAPTSRDEMLARVVTRGRRIRMINRVLVGLMVGGVAAAGVVGVSLGYSGTVSMVGGAEASVSSDAGSLTYFGCPEVGAMGQFQGGDRVYLTGRVESGEWVQVRSPEDQLQRVWIQGEHVDPDEVVELPVVGCSDAVTEMALVDATATTTTTEPVETVEPETVEPDETTTTTGPEPTTTTRPGQTTSTTTAPPSTTTPTTSTTTTAPTTSTTTTPPTTTTTIPDPVISSASVSPTPMIRRDQPAGSCEDWFGGHETSTVRADGVANASSVTWVARIGGQQVAQGSLGQSLQVPGRWQGPIGPFPQAGQQSSDQVTVTITASGPGGSTNRNTSFALNDCFFG